MNGFISCNKRRNMIKSFLQVGWKTGSRGVGVGNGERGVGSEYQLFFSDHPVTFF